MIYQNIYEELTQVYDSILSIIPADIKYYHPISLKNFVTHFDKLGSQHDKYKVFEYFSNYRDYLENNIVQNSHESKITFDKFIRPIGEIYKVNAKFKFISGYDLIFIFVIMVNVLLLAFHSSTITFSLVNIISLFMIYREIKVRISTKFYGFNY